ncbi:serine protein kinase RIO [Candidatus Woesearchaeota archaeon]|nr:serine protein kinase RIO [Candidatus Woesearchaeota archaeon]
MAKKTREEWKTYQDVFDQFTIRTLWDLSSKGFLDGLKSPVSLGKEANVFTAEKGNEILCAKIYRLEVADFNAMYKYIRNDPRFSGLQHQRRKVIFAWCQREFRNLLKCKEAGISCPKPIIFKNNVLLMELIGEPGEPAPRLKDKPPSAPNKFFKKVLDNMKKLHKLNLVHADLSEYNILNDNEKPVFIDFSHTTPLDTPNADELVKRDIANTCRYFKKLGVKTTEKNIWDYITG